MATTARQHTARPMSYYWGVVKEMDDSQKLELIAMLAESVKPAYARPNAEPAPTPPPMRRYTMDEINAMLDEAEADIAAGRTIPHEVVMREMEEEFALEEQKELEMVEAL